MKLRTLCIAATLAFVAGCTTTTSIAVAPEPPKEVKIISDWSITTSTSEFTGELASVSLTFFNRSSVIGCHLLPTGNLHYIIWMAAPTVHYGESSIIYKVDSNQPSTIQSANFDSLRDFVSVQPSYNEMVKFMDQLHDSEEVLFGDGVNVIARLDITTLTSSDIDEFMRKCATMRIKR